MECHHLNSLLFSGSIGSLNSCKEYLNVVTYNVQVLV